MGKGFKLLGITKDGTLVYRISNNKYDPHCGKRQRLRNLKRMLADPERRPLGTLEGDLVTTYLELKAQ